MNPFYALLGAPFWLWWGKKVSLWYAHGHVPLLLQIADRLIDIAFTSTPEGYRLKSKRLRIVGQGINTEKFIPAQDVLWNDAPLRLVSVGRISPTKNYATLFRALQRIPREMVASVKIVGRPATERDEKYFTELRDMVHEFRLEDIVQFQDAVPNKDLVPILQNADVFVSMSHTGSLDKANLEAMSCGLVLITCNEAFASLLGAYTEKLMYEKENDSELSAKLIAISILGASQRRKLGLLLRSIVMADHTLSQLISRISSLLIARLAGKR